MKYVCPCAVCGDYVEVLRNRPQVTYCQGCSDQITYTQRASQGG